jgi:hypothetical protein
MPKFNLLLFFHAGNFCMFVGLLKDRVLSNFRRIFYQFITVLQLMRHTYVQYFSLTDLCICLWIILFSLMCVHAHTHMHARAHYIIISLDQQLCVLYNINLLIFIAFQMVCSKGKFKSSGFKASP